jgi:hypothetical protein
VPRRAHDGSAAQGDITKSTLMWRFAMGDVIVLRSIPIDLNSTTGHQFVVDCTRAAEGLLTDKELQEKYELSPVDWRNITKDTALMRAIQAERERRVLNGTAVREAACRHFVKAPGILDQIMMDAHSNPRHKIEAIKELRQTAIGNSPESLPESERFIITINLGEGHVEHYDKPIKPIKIDVSDGDDPNNLIPLEGKSDADE